MQQLVEQKVLSRIYGNGRGWAFSQADFADLGARSTIDSALHRRERDGVIRRVIRGIYHYPRHSKALGGPISPNIDQIAHALARKFNWRIQPNGATAQNLLGLSTQVPARAVYLSDGPARSYTIGRTKLDFEHTALKEAGFKLPESRLIVQALKAFGEDRITPKVITQVRRQFDSALLQRILLDTKTATGWVYAAIQEIARDGGNGLTRAAAGGGSARHLQRGGGSTGDQANNYRKGLLGLRRAEISVPEIAVREIPRLQGRHIAFESTRADRTVLRRHRSCPRLEPDRGASGIPAQVLDVTHASAAAHVSAAEPKKLTRM